MPHWRQEAKENARLVRNAKSLVEALELAIKELQSIADISGIQTDLRPYRAAIAKVKANSTEPVE